MNTFKIALRSGQTATIEDRRALGDLAAQLAQEGFVVVRRISAGYAKSVTEVAFLERAIESIEPAA